MELSGSRLKSSSSERVNKKKKNRQFRGKVKESHTLGVRKAIDKKKKYIRQQKNADVFDLSALSDCLPKLEVPDQPSVFVLQVTRKTKKKLILKKGIQVGNFVCHPAFQPDTMVSIHPQSQNTLCVFLRRQVSNVGIRKGKKRRIKKSVASANLPQAMEC